MCHFPLFSFFIFLFWFWFWFFGKFVGWWGDADYVEHFSDNFQTYFLKKFPLCTIERVFAPDFAHKGKLCGFGDALQQMATPLDVGFAFQIGTTKALAWGWKFPGICKGRHFSASGRVSKFAADTSLFAFLTTSYQFFLTKANANSSFCLRKQSRVWIKIRKRPKIKIY